MAFELLLERDEEITRQQNEAETDRMTIAFATAYAITFSEASRAIWNAQRDARLGVVDGAHGGRAALERLAAHLGPGVVRRRDS